LAAFLEAYYPQGFLAAHLVLVVSHHLPLPASRRPDHHLAANHLVVLVDHSAALHLDHLQHQDSRLGRRLYTAASMDYMMLYDVRCIVYVVHNKENAAETVEPFFGACLRTKRQQQDRTGGMISPAARIHSFRRHTLTAVSQHFGMHLQLLGNTLP
jgi:hypothetical protein